MRILLHPGFHKTGTSSLQRGAAARATELAPHLRVMVTADVIGAARAARSFSARRTKASLRDFAVQFSETLTPLDPADDRALLISCEDFSGYIPGNHGVAAYDAAPALMNVAAAVLRTRFGPETRVTIWYTTRDAADWQRSVYWQNLRALRVTEDFEDYRPRLDRAARLYEIVAATDAHLGGRARVTSTRIEDCGPTRLGPLGAALDLLEIDASGLDPLPAQNVQPDGAAEELLALNRTDLNDDDLAEAKRRVLQKHRKSGLTRRMPGT